MCHVTVPDFPSRSRLSFSVAPFELLIERERHDRTFLHLLIASTPLSIPLITINMSITSQAAARCCRQLVRPSASLRLSATYQQTISRRWQSTEAPAAPANPKITQIVDQISQLNLLETADLVASLKVSLSNIPSQPLHVVIRCPGCLRLRIETSVPKIIIQKLIIRRN